MTMPALLVVEPAGIHPKPPLVVDSSVIAVVLFDEPEREEAMGVLRGKDLFAPDLLDYELVSVAVAKARSGLAEVVRQGLDDLARLQLTRCRIDTGAICELAIRYDLSGYDAAYLWLAGELRAPLATFDRRLAEAARQHFAAG